MDPTPNNEESKPDQGAVQTTLSAVAGELTVHDSIGKKILKLPRKCWESLKKDETTNGVIAIFTIVIAVTGIFYAIFAGLQWCEMRRAGKQTARTISILEAQQRPWIAPYKNCIVEKSMLDKHEVPLECDVGRVLDSLKDGDQLEAWTEVYNTGQIPAMNVTLNIAVCVSRSKEDAPPTLEECADTGQSAKRKGAPVFQASVSLRHRIDVGPVILRLDAKDLDGLRSVPPSQFLYLIGHSEYLAPNDTKTHSTDFCLLYAPHNETTGTRGDALRWCYGGNRAN